MRIFPDDDGKWEKTLAKGGGIALIIRIAGAGLSYLMFVILARRMSAEEYGNFGFAFSLVTFFSTVADFGQRTLVLRFIPLYEHDGRRGLVRAIVSRGYAVSLVGILAVVVTAGTATTVIPAAHASPGYFLWSAVFLASLTFAEYLAAVLRAMGRVTLALLPRDIGWRGAVIVAAVLAMPRLVPANSEGGMALCACLLSGFVFLQAFFHWEARPGLSFDAAATSAERREWRRASLGLWGATMIPAVIPNLSVVVLGLILSPSETGPFFTALRTAALLNLPLTAANVIGAPLIARYFQIGQVAQVQKISNYIVLGVTGPVLLGFLIVALWGDVILGFFGPGFSAAKPVLVIVAFGNLVNALCGPTGFMMSMTGHERKYLAVIATTSAASIAVLPLMASACGSVGGALAVAAGMVSWNIWVWHWTRKTIGIDPTIWGVVEAFRNDQIGARK